MSVRFLEIDKHLVYLRHINREILSTHGYLTNCNLKL